MPLAVTVPKLLVLLLSVILPAVPEPVVMKFAVPVTARLVPAACVMAPPVELTVRQPVDVTLARTVALLLKIVMFVPQAVILRFE